MTVPAICAKNPPLKGFRVCSHLTALLLLAILPGSAGASGGISEHHGHAQAPATALGSSGFEELEQAVARKKNTTRCGWGQELRFTDRDSDIFALAVYDDGSGPALYAGGSFARAYGSWVNHVGKWNGSYWQGLSGGGTNGTVEAWAVYDDGSGPAIYAGGWFSFAGGVRANYIAKWDGAAWSALSGPAGTGTNDTVRALAVYDDGSGPALYVGGDFTTAGGVEANRIAKWDGTQWSALSGPSGTGTNGGVHALAGYDDGGGEALYVGGDFTTAGGVETRRIASWDGTAWRALSGPAGNGTDGTVRALATYSDTGGSALFAGGDFTTAGGVVVNRIARWDGIAWTALSGPAGIGTDAGIYALAGHDDGSGSALYAGGHFTTAGGATASHVARWNGTTWAPVGIGPGYGIYAFTVWEDGGGEALVAGGNSAAATWNGTAWSGLGTVGSRPEVNALEVFDDGTGPALFAVGNFTTAGGVTVNKVAKWDGVTWSALSGPAGTGLSDLAYALAVYDDGNGEALYVGGRFTVAGGVTVNRLAKWDGTSFSALSGPAGTGLSDRIQALAVYDDGSGEALYAAGRFITAGGVTVNRIAKWDGTQWSALIGPAGTGANDWIYALAVYDDGGGAALYAGGNLTTAGGVTVNHVAKWDGTAWSALSGPDGTGTDGSLAALAVYDDGTGKALYAGGWPITAGGVTVNHVAKWDGTAWSALSGPLGTGTNGTYIEVLAAYDDGSGEALYAGGWFTMAGGVPVNYIARWDGTAWSALSGPAGTGTDYGVGSLAVWDDGSGQALYAGGWFDTAGGVSSSRIARWSCQRPRGLYLNNNRFHVEVLWGDFAGHSGVGEPVELTDEAGYFWFFNEDNVELVVKALDACVSPFNRFWIFAAGLTNVETWITVTDTVTEDQNRYSNALGQAFEPILDTDAFATCSAQRSQAARSPEKELRSLEAVLTELNRGNRRPGAGRTELYLNNNRFKVEVTWGDFAGNTGVGQAVPLTGDTGYFWFFNPENIELVVKVLDACVDPYNRFWIFAAGLTNVEVTMTVTDTVTWQERVYHNPLSQKFTPILDTSAFSTCDARGR